MAKFWGTTPSQLLDRSVRDFTLDRLLAIRLSEEDENDDQDDGDMPAHPPAARRLPTEWIAPNLPI